MIGGTSSDRRALEREALRNVINQWNANRLDLFELSEPNEVSPIKPHSKKNTFKLIIIIIETKAIYIIFAATFQLDGTTHD